MALLKQEAIEDIIKTRDRVFFFMVDNLDLNDGQYNKSNHNSPDKSAKSTTSRRKRRNSQLGTTLQKELMNLKRANIRPVKMFDDDLHRSLRPVFIFDDDFLDNIHLVLNSLVLKKVHKTMFQEMVYFKPEDFTYSLREFETSSCKEELLRFVQSKIKEYESSGRRKAHIRLAFEDTIMFLNRLELLEDKFANQVTNMFKYDNEDIIGIYEVFILTRDFQDFIETLIVFQNSKYFEKNQRAQIELIQGEKTFSLLESIQTYVEEFIMVYYDRYSRQLLTKMIKEANEDLITFARQYHSFTEKSSHQLTGYIQFNIHLSQFLEKNLKEKYMRKMSIRNDTQITHPAPPEKAAVHHSEMEVLLKSEDFKVATYHAELQRLQSLVREDHKAGLRDHAGS